MKELLESSYLSAMSKANDSLRQKIERLNNDLGEMTKLFAKEKEKNKQAIEYIEKHCKTNPHLSALLVESEIVELLDILKGVDKE